MSIGVPLSFYVSPLFIKLSDREVKLGGSSAKQVRLRDFQHKLLKLFLDRESPDVILLSAPTGAGKTLSLLIPLLANLPSQEQQKEPARWMYDGSVGIYPSRELAKDQMVSIANMLLKMGASQVDIRELYEELSGLGKEELETISEHIKVFEVSLNKEAKIPIVLILITSDSLNKLREVIDGHVEGIKNRRMALEYLWEKIKRRAYRIIFTVPEYPYLLATDVYQDFHRAGVWLYAVQRELREFLRVLESGDAEELRSWLKELETKIDRRRVFEEFYTSREFTTELAKVFLMFRVPVFFDEFHLYSGFSLAPFISLLFIYMCERGVRKLVISSATPVKSTVVREKSKDLLKLVKFLAKSMGYNFTRISAEVSNTPREGFAQIRKRTLTKVVPVILRGKHVTGAPAYGAVQRHVCDVLRETGWLDMYREKGRAMILVDRVASVLEIKECVKRLTGREALTVTSIRSLFKPSEGGLRKAELIVGNMAIAFGVDIKGMDLGVVVAKDRFSALQKIGRYGRSEGEDLAVIYLPLPYFKFREVKERLERIKGEEIPYISNPGEASGGGRIDLIALLEELYPRETPDALVRHVTGVFKVLFPVWVYIMASIIRLRSEEREELHSARRLEDVRFMRYFASLMKGVREFFEVKGLERKLRRFMRYGVFLTPSGLYNLYSYRNVAGVPVKMYGEDGVREELLSLIVVGRNIPLKYKDGEFQLDSSRGYYEYTLLWIGVKQDEAVKRIKDFLAEADHKVLTLQFVIEMLGGDAFLYQGERKVCRITALLNNECMRDLPTLVLNMSRGRKGFIEYLSAVDSMIPIHIVEKYSEQGELLGGIYLL